MIAKPIVPRELANRDVDQAIAYYRREASDEVARAFVRALEMAYRHIRRHPGSGASRYAVELNLPGLRSWPLKRFPHVIFYIETRDRIDIWRVLHSARDIPAWMERN
ncbi:MAG: type II toxin-antitoxin system RelE/ParE family toxin [Alphaproteobacteria bacterium]|nr:type II toxin-antitoxin system RelE/ParE family toxin [Alphaproteobacteria bacterium]